MSTIIGRQQNIGVAKESTRGTAVNPTIWVPTMEHKVEDKVVVATNEQSFGVIEDSLDTNVTQMSAEVTMKGRVETGSFGFWLLQALGQDAVTGSGPYTHTMTVNQSAQHPTATFTLVDPSSGTVQYALGALDNIELSMDAKGFLTWATKHRANSAVTAGAQTPAYVAAPVAFTPFQGVVSLGANLAGLPGTTVNIASAKLTFAKNVEDYFSINGSQQASDRFNKQLAISGSLELVFTDRTQIQNMLNDVAQAMRIKFTNGTHSVQFDLARVKWQAVGMASGNNDIVKQTITFKAFYSAADAKSVVAILINNTPSY